MQFVKHTVGRFARNSLSTTSALDVELGSSTFIHRVPTFFCSLYVIAGILATLVTVRYDTDPMGILVEDNCRARSFCHWVDFNPGP